MTAHPVITVAIDEKIGLARLEGVHDGIASYRMVKGAYYEERHDAVRHAKYLTEHAPKPLEAEVKP